MRAHKLKVTFLNSTWDFDKTEGYDRILAPSVWCFEALGSVQTLRYERIHKNTNEMSSIKPLILYSVYGSSYNYISLCNPVLHNNEKSVNVTLIDPWSNKPFSSLVVLQSGCGALPCNSSVFSSPINIPIRINVGIVWFCESQGLVLFIFVCLIHVKFLQ